MPYTITNEGDYLLFRLSGVVSSEEMHGLITEGQALEDTMETVLNRITDLTSVERFAFPSKTIEAIAARRLARTFPNFFKSAIIADRPEALGLARMFQTLNDHPQIEIKILGSVQEAKDWLAGKPVAFR